MISSEDTNKYDLFVSYVKADRSWVKGYLLATLDQADISYLTEEAFELGPPTDLSFERAVQQCRKIILVLSPAYVAKDVNQRLELLAQHYGTVSGTWPVIPLVLHQVTLPLRLSYLKSLDATDQADWAPAIELLIKSLGQEVRPPAPIPPPPYPGMRPFQEDESAYFFGREEEIAELLIRVKSHSLVILIGPSGSGKSSLVKAGVIPHIRRSTAFGAGEWLFRTFRPGADPLASLADALGGDLSDLAGAVERLLKSEEKARRLFLFVDQFEEVFTLARKDASLFQETLLQLAQVPGVYLVVAVRADFYHALMDHPAFWLAVEAYRFELLALKEEALARAVNRPAEEVNVSIEPVLVERLVADAGGEPGILPFVQETMISMWDKIEQRYLPLSAYEALVLPRSAYFTEEKEGQKRTGLQVAVALQAEKAYASPGLADKDLARRLFLRLVQFGEGRPHTRRQMNLAQLRLTTPDGDRLDQVIQHFIEYRLLVSSGKAKKVEEQTKVEEYIDLAHEVLIESWPRLAYWIEQGMDSEQKRRQLVADVQAWYDKKRATGYLYLGERLQGAMEWAAGHAEDKTQGIQEFLDASQQYQGRQRLLRFVGIGALAVVLLLILVVSVNAARQAWLRREAASETVTFAGQVEIQLGFPPQAIRVADAFKLDIHEVSVGQFRLCLRAGKCANPAGALDLDNLSGSSQDETLPIRQVSAANAAQYCAWLGGRLPSVVEWEYAARGDTYRPWPWGTAKPSRDRVNMGLIFPPVSFSDGPVAVTGDAYAAGRTPEGVWHLLGNVAEWTSTSAENCSLGHEYTCPTWDAGQNAPKTLYVAGWSWYADVQASDSSIVSRFRPEVSTLSILDNVGFRCAYPAEA